MPTCTSCGEVKGLFEMREGLCKSCRIRQVERYSLPTEKTVRKSINSTIKIILNSGTALDLTEVMLYDLNLIQETFQLEAIAKENLEGFSTGLGFIGNLGSVVMSSLILGMFENSVSKARASEGMEMMEKVNILRNKIQLSGKYFPISEIHNIDKPYPQNWFVEQVAIGKYKPVVYVPLQDNFFNINTSQGNCHIRWENVEHFSII